jgi:outer membrane protein assembly factor BamB
VHALSADGIERWSTGTRGALFATPAVLGNAILIAHDGAFDAIDSHGTTLWSHAVAGEFDASPLVGPDGTVYLASRSLEALGPSGAPRWHVPVSQRVRGTPALSRDAATVYVADVSGELLYVRARDGSVQHRVRVPGPIHAGLLALDDGSVVVASADGHVRAFGPDGAARWDFTTRDEVRSTPALTRDGIVVFGSDDGGIYGVHASNGTQAFRVATVGRVRASARIDADGWIFIGSEDDTLYALDPHGTVAWSLPLGGDIDDSVLLTPWGALAVGCDDAALYYLTAPPRPPNGR